MAKRKTNKKVPAETDAVFLLKIFLYFLLGSLWVRFDGSTDDSLVTIGLPIGFMIGLYFANHEVFQIDRKLEYVVLILAMVLSYIAPVGFVLVI